MRLLGIDTATTTTGAALIEDDRLIAETCAEATAGHAERLMPAIEGVLADAGWRRSDIDAIAVSAGPGSYTGLRTGVTTAKMLAYAWRRRLVAVGTLDALAWQGRHFDGLISPLIPYRGGRVVAALYEGEKGGGPGRPRLVAGPDHAPLVAWVQQVVACNRRTLFLGELVGRAWDEIRAALGERAFRPDGPGDAGSGPKAALLRPASVAFLGRQLASAGDFADPFDLVPLYLRRPEAELKWPSEPQSPS